MTGGESAKVNITCNDSVVEILDSCSLAKVSRKVSEIVKKSSDSKIFCTLDVSSEIMRKLVTYCVKRNYQPESDPDKPFSTEDEKWIREEFSKEEEDPKKLFELFKVCAYRIFIYRTLLGFGLHFFAFCYIYYRVIAQISWICTPMWCVGFRVPSIYTSKWSDQKDGVEEQYIL